MALKHPVHHDQFLEDFASIVRREPRTKLGLTIVTAADSDYFLPAQLLYLSLRHSHDCRFVWIDLGLSDAQRHWCQTADGIELLAMPAECPHPKTTHGWQTWNKPYYVRSVWQTSERVLWLDADMLVVGPLDTLDAMIAERAFTCHCFAATMLAGDYRRGMRSLGNRPQLYERFPVPRRLTIDRPNAGVVGLRVGRDDDLLNAWVWMVARASDDPQVASWLRWWDQGALQWAMESTGRHHCVSHELRFNDPCSVQPGRMGREEFLSALEAVNSQARILHFPAGNKPYRAIKADA